MSVKPEDVLAEEVNTVTVEGIQVRKGTVGAVIANARIVSSPYATELEKAEAKNMIRMLAPAILAIGLHHHVTWKNPEIQAIFDECSQ